MKTRALLLGMAFVLTVLAGCHTIHGAGQDIERGGEHIQKAAS